MIKLPPQSKIPLGIIFSHFWKEITPNWLTLPSIITFGPKKCKKFNLQLQVNILFTLDHHRLCLAWPPISVWPPIPFITLRNLSLTSILPHHRAINCKKNLKCALRYYKSPIDNEPISPTWWGVTLTSLINMYETHKVSAEGHNHPLQGAWPRWRLFPCQGHYLFYNPVLLMNQY